MRRGRWPTGIRQATVGECKNFKAGGPAGMGPRGDVTVDVLRQLARGHTAARDGFKQISGGRKRLAA
jgi:hypothetical protein